MSKEIDKLREELKSHLRTAAEYEYRDVDPDVCCCGLVIGQCFDGYCKSTKDSLIENYVEGRIGETKPADPSNDSEDVCIDDSIDFT